MNTDICLSDLLHCCKRQVRTSALSSELPGGYPAHVGMWEQDLSNGSRDYIRDFLVNLHPRNKCLWQR